MNDIRKLIETIEEALQGTANDEVSAHLEAAAKALAKDAVQQAAGVWEEEGDGEGKFKTGATTGREYVRIAAPRFLDKEVKNAVMTEFTEYFHEYVEYFLEYVDAGAEPDWDNAE